MKKLITLLLLLTSTMFSLAGENNTVSSPDGHIVVCLNDDGGKLTYTVSMNGKTLIEPSALGLNTSFGDFASGMKMLEIVSGKTKNEYDMTRTKVSHVNHDTNVFNVTCENAHGKRIVIDFQVTNEGVAYRYELPYNDDDKRSVKIFNEASSFRFPEKTTTFLCPQIKAMEGWMQTKPSYEEEYTADAQMTAKSQFGEGYTFPCLFRIGDDGWALVSETGVTGKYCASHLSDYSSENGYTVAFPMKEECNGIGFDGAAMGLPAETPWRIIVLGKTLKPIVENTLAYDVVSPLYEPTKEYKPGRYTWSWLLWQDNSVNYDDQVKFIDLASYMGYEYCLVDNWWDKNIGRKRMAELSRYAQSKGVKLMLWYNSNGAWNNAPQSPRDLMDNSIIRKNEMAWLKSIGVAGIKVDFFGSDKQNTMQLYEDILSDANDYGLQVIFHGCTLPRGWERMYPNYVASEAVLASENLFFTQHHCDKEGFELTMHPFCRNAVASMDWGGTVMNRRMNRDNSSRNYRRTSDVFEMASAIVNQTSIQCVAIQPNNLTELPEFELNWLKSIPTTWDETQYIDGYPGKYVVIARKHGDKWIVAGLNGTSSVMTLKIKLPMFAGKTFTCYTDDKAHKGENQLPVSIKKEIKVSKDGEATVMMQSMGGLIIE